MPNLCNVMVPTEPTMNPITDSIVKYQPFPILFINGFIPAIPAAASPHRTMFPAAAAVLGVS
jgi:hypothetical protein